MVAFDDVTTQGSRTLSAVVFGLVIPEYSGSIATKVYFMHLHIMGSVMHGFQKNGYAWYIQFNSLYLLSDLN